MQVEPVLSCLYLTVLFPVFIIIVLLLVVLLRFVCVFSHAKHFKLCKRPYLILCRCDTAGSPDSISCIVGVLCACHNDILPVGRKCIQELGADGRPHVAVLPASGIRVFGIHAKSCRTTSISVRAVHKCDVLPRRGFPKLEMDAVITFNCRVVVKAYNYSIIRPVKGQRPDLSAQLNRDLSPTLHRFFACPDWAASLISAGVLSPSVADAILTVTLMVLLPGALWFVPAAHFYGDRDRSGCLCSNGDRCTAHTYGRDSGVA